MDDAVATEVTVTLLSFLEFVQEGNDNAVYRMMTDESREKCGGGPAAAWALAELGWAPAYLDRLLQRLGSPLGGDQIVASLSKNAFGENAVVVWTRGPTRLPVPFVVDHVAHRVTVSPPVPLSPDLVQRLAEMTAEKPPN